MFVKISLFYINNKALYYLFDPQEYAGEEFRTGLPLAGPVPLPADRAALLMQYSRYSNDYSDHAFPPNIDFKVIK